MSAIELLHAALPPIQPPGPMESGVCCVLGTREPSIDRRLAIKPSFTNLDLLRAPDSPHIGARAWRVLTHGVPAAEGKKRDTFPLMQSSWIVRDGSLTLLDRKAVRQHVLSGVSADAWAGYVTTSYKKHGSLRAPVNRHGAQRWLFELDVIDCTDRATVSDYWARLRRLRESGIPRPVIETLDIGPALMGKHLREWLAFEPWARTRLRSPLYRLMTYLLPSEEELRA